MMTLERELHQLLRAMLEQIEAGPDASEDGPSLVDQLRRIDQLKEELGAQAPSMLQHYLDKRSYAKALDFLEGRDETIAPNC